MQHQYEMTHHTGEMSIRVDSTQSKATVTLLARADTTDDIAMDGDVTCEIAFPPDQL